MKTNLKDEANEIEKKIISIGNDLSVAASLVKYLDLSINDSFGLSNKDIANLTIALRNLLDKIVEEYDSFECSLDI